MKNVLSKIDFKVFPACFVESYEVISGQEDYFLVEVWDYGLLPISTPAHSNFCPFQLLPIPTHQKPGQIKVNIYLVSISNLHFKKVVLSASWNILNRPFASCWSDSMRVCSLRDFLWQMKINAVTQKWIIVFNRKYLHIMKLQKHCYVRAYVIFV